MEKLLFVEKTFHFICRVDIYPSGLHSAFQKRMYDFLRFFFLKIQDISKKYSRKQKEVLFWDGTKNCKTMPNSVTQKPHFAIQNICLYIFWIFGNAKSKSKTKTESYLIEGTKILVVTYSLTRSNLSFHISAHNWSLYSELGVQQTYASWNMVKSLFKSVKVT